jgi:amidohydrolase
MTKIWRQAMQFDARAVQVASILLALGSGGAAWGAGENLDAHIDRLSAELESSVITTRRFIHQHPELGNREFATADYIASRLRSLGYQVQTGVARTGVVGVLKGGRPGPVVALRSELDALPVTEDVDLPFKSLVRTEYAGQQTGVMHACGHDAHMAILLGAAEVFAKLKTELPGTVKLIFQPAEEGGPPGEEFGAKLMVKEGVLSNPPKPEVIFGLHVMSMFDVGTIAYRAGGLMASSDDFTIKVHGRQTHAALPWNGVDPVVVAAQIVLGLQTIASRQLDVTKAPVVISIGLIEGGVKSNIIPDTVTMIGTVRALDPGMRLDTEKRIERTADNIAAASGATAETVIDPDLGYAVLYNDPALTMRMLGTLRRVAGEAHVVETTPMTTGEDFSAYQERIPGLFVLLGVRTPGASPGAFPPNHSPRFRIDESALALGVRTLTHLAVDYMTGTR